MAAFHLRISLTARAQGTLRQRIKDAVVELLDLELWERAEKVEKVEMASIRDAVNRWNNLAIADPRQDIRAGK